MRRLLFCCIRSTPPRPATVEIEPPQEPEKTKTGARGHFDLCLWDPLTVNQRFFRSNGGVLEQETFIAIEFDLVENQVPAWEALHHVKWDLLKLSDPENQVKHGFMLFFTRNWMNRKEFLQLAKEQLNYTGETTTLYVESSLQGKRHTTFQDL